MLSKDTRPVSSTKFIAQDILISPSEVTQAIASEPRRRNFLQSYTCASKIVKALIRFDGISVAHLAKQCSRILSGLHPRIYGVSLSLISLSGFIKASCQLAALIVLECRRKIGSWKAYGSQKL